MNRKYRHETLWVFFALYGANEAPNELQFHRNETIPSGFVRNEGKQKTKRDSTLLLMKAWYAEIWEETVGTNFYSAISIQELLVYQPEKTFENYMNQIRIRQSQPWNIKIYDMKHFFLGNENIAINTFLISETLNWQWTDAFIEFYKRILLLKNIRTGHIPSTNVKVKKRAITREIEPDLAIQTWPSSGEKCVKSQSISRSWIKCLLRTWSENLDRYLGSFLKLDFERKWISRSRKQTRL